MAITRSSMPQPLPRTADGSQRTASQTSEDLLALFDTAPLNRRYWAIFALISAVFVFDFFDFLVVGYLLAAVASEWHLTYGQSATILYSGGVGAIVGAVVFGAFADAWGRKPQMVIGTFICALSSGLIASLCRKAAGCCSQSCAFLSASASPPR
jgi:MFS family permease